MPHKKNRRQERQTAKRQALCEAEQLKNRRWPGTRRYPATCPKDRLSALVAVALFGRNF